MSGGDSLRHIASQTSFSKSSLGKWRYTGRPPADAVIAIAKAYDADIVAGLVSAGCIDEKDIGAIEWLRGVPTELLIEELHRRWQDGEISAPTEQPIG